MSRMFPFITHTINPLGGGPCPYKCTYCWATDMKNQYKWEKYKGPWRIYKKELKKYKPGAFVFPFDMIDIGYPSIPSWIIHPLLTWIREQPDVDFLLLTKNPSFFTRYKMWIPTNCVMGATIESDIAENITPFSKAPPPLVRIESMKGHHYYHRTFVSVEPIMNFTPLFANRLSYIRPWAIAVGYDNYKNGLPEPALAKTKDFISDVDKYTTVHIKTLRDSSPEATE